MCLMVVVCNHIEVELSKAHEISHLSNHKSHCLYQLAGKVARFLFHFQYDFDKVTHVSDRNLNVAILFI